LTNATRRAREYKARAAAADVRIKKRNSRSLALAKTRAKAGRIIKSAAQIFLFPSEFFD
jgi:hypothetical protein